MLSISRAVMLGETLPRMTGWRALLAATCICGGLFGCGPTLQRQPEHAAASESASESVSESVPDTSEVGVAPECVDDKDQRVECLSDGDCCAGFVCGKDPELSQRVSYCMYGG
jgi:hypothetical protein